MWFKGHTCKCTSVEYLFHSYPLSHSLSDSKSVFTSNEYNVYWRRYVQKEGFTYVSTTKAEMCQQIRQMTLTFIDRLHHQRNWIIHRWIGESQNRLSKCSVCPRPSLFAYGIQTESSYVGSSIKHFKPIFPWPGLIHLVNTYISALLFSTISLVFKCLLKCKVFTYFYY